VYGLQGVIVGQALKKVPNYQKHPEENALSVSNNFVDETGVTRVDLYQLLVLIVFPELIGNILIDVFPGKVL
jgi:hypothetical protein